MARSSNTPPPPARRLARPPHAADYARCSIRTIRRRIADGTLTAYRLGPGVVCIDLNELDAAFRPIPNAATPVRTP
jgi:excisionase family DNA binding protein